MIIEWLKKNTQQIESPNLYYSGHDLDFLKELLRGKNIVSMGEATHGTSEFAQMKGRFFKFLVTEMGFNLFALEADFGAALSVNDYILYGKGDAKEVLDKVKYFHCRNAETLELIHWMRSYNEKPSNQKKVKFYGFDCQSSNASIERLSSYFKEVDNSFSKNLDTVEYKESPHKYFTPFVSEQFTNLLDDHLNKNKKKFIKKSSEKAWELAKVLVKELNFARDINMHGFASTKRDQYMADLVKFILQYEEKGSKIMLWAHNGHVKYASSNIRSGGSFPRFGLCLKKYYDKELFTIGFDFNKGNFYAKDKVDGKYVGKIYHVDEAPKETFSHILSLVNKPILFFDLGRVKNDSIIETWFSKIRKIRGIGAQYRDAWAEDGSFTNNILPEQYDALIFVNETQAITSLYPPLKK